MFNSFKKQKNVAEEESAEEISREENDNTREDLEKEFTFHVMPERFRAAHFIAHSAKKMGLVILIGGVVFFIVILIAAYFFFFKSSPDKKSETNIAAQAPIEQTKTTATSSQEETIKPSQDLGAAKQAYLDMRKELDAAASLDQLYVVLNKYGSQKIISSNSADEQSRLFRDMATSTKQSVASTTPLSFSVNVVSLINSMFGANFSATSTEKVNGEELVKLFQGLHPRAEEITSIQGEITVDTATLQVTTNNSGETGVIVMVFEDNAWKLASEKWVLPSSSETATVTSAPSEVVYKQGIDTDGDGLTDAEEKALKTNINNKDMDGDGYSDFTEIMNLYDPMVYANGKLVKNPAIREYKNNSFGYSLLYPAAWSLTPIGGNDSIIIKSDDGHFIQIIAQPNINKESIEEWYKKQFNTTSIAEANLITGNSWQGVKNENGLVVYLADQNNSFIFTISYSPGESNILEYKNVFTMLIKSFTVSN